MAHLEYLLGNIVFMRPTDVAPAMSWRLSTGIGKARDRDMRCNFSERPIHAVPRYTAIITKSTRSTTL